MHSRNAACMASTNPCSVLVWMRVSLYGYHYSSAFKSWLTGAFDFIYFDFWDNSYSKLMFGFIRQSWLGNLATVKRFECYVLTFRALGLRFDRIKELWITVGLYVVYVVNSGPTLLSHSKPNRAKETRPQHNINWKKDPRSYLRNLGRCEKKHNMLKTDNKSNARVPNFAGDLPQTRIVVQWENSLIIGIFTLLFIAEKTLEYNTVQSNAMECNLMQYNLHVKSQSQTNTSATFFHRSVRQEN